MLRRVVFSLALLVVVSPSSRAVDKDFVPLLSGNDLSRFEVVGIGPETVSVREGVLRLGGDRKGYVATKEGFKNYVLKFEWMFDPAFDLIVDLRHNGNSGLLVNIQGPSQVWPRAIEVQVWHKPFGSFFTLGGATFHPAKDIGARADFYRPPGQWNQHEVTCRNGAITVRVNGVDVGQGKDANPDHGRIGWMSEDGPVLFRNLMIKRMGD